MSAITQLVYEIFAPNGGFRELPISLCKWNLCQTNPRCHGNENVEISTQKLQ